MHTTERGASHQHDRSGNFLECRQTEVVAFARSRRQRYDKVSSVMRPRLVQATACYFVNLIQQERGSERISDSLIFLCCRFRNKIAEVVNVVPQKCVQQQASEQELKALADTTQVLQSEKGEDDADVFTVPERSASGLWTATDLKGFDMVPMVKDLPKRRTPP